MKLLFYIAFLVLSINGFGQSASLKIDDNELRIGEQTVIRLFFEYQNPAGNALIVWPNYDDDFTKDIEIVEKTIDVESLIDSATATYQREQRLVITAFEAGEFEIPAQEIRLGDSVYYSNTEMLIVETIQVDTSKGIFDIKPIYSVDYPFSERSKDWFKLNWYWIAIVLGLILILFGWRYFKNRKPEVEDEVLEEIIPAHIIALETLEKLLVKEEWKSTEKKKYYSDLTDTVRLYLENRFEIHAMEQTTREIIRDLKQSSISDTDKAYLKKIMREADMVKFAKLAPNDEDAYSYLNKSIDFVKRTKVKDLNEN